MKDVMQYLTLGDSTLPLAMMFRAIVLGATVLLLTGLYSILQTLIRPMFSPLRLLKGPGGASILFGHLKQIIDSPSPSSWEAEQLNTYGHVLVFKFAFNQDRLLTTDRKALHHILTNSSIYIKGIEFRRAIMQIAGKGILYQEGNGHKRHRRIMNPAFGTAPLREMTGIFVNKANEMRDALDIAYRKESTTEWTEVDMVQYFTGATLDIIGLAGFNHQFDSIHHLVEGTRPKDEFSVALRKTFKHLGSFSLLDLLKSYIPVLRLINFDPRSLAIKKEREIVKAISGPMIREKKIALQIPSEKNNAKDLLALLIQANTREGGENAARSLTEEEVMDQIPTFLIAGHETTSTAMSWTLITLATHPDVQSRLRQELLEVSTENPTMEELNALPYLERVIRESLRYNSIVPGTWRVAAQDDVIPLEKPYIDKNGNIRHEIRVAKGDGVIIPIKIINQLEEIWGPDAKQFNPDRWLNLPEASGDIPGVWGNQLTFIGGPRACIGFRFSLVEMKALLFAIVRSFELKLPVPPEEIIGSKMGPTTRPSIRSRPERGVHLPILIKPIKQD